MNSLREISLTLCPVPLALLVLAYAPLGLGYGQLLLGVLSLSLSVCLTVFGLAFWLLFGDAEPGEARGSARGSWLAGTPLMLYILFAIAQPILRAFNLLT